MHISTKEIFKLQPLTKEEVDKLNHAMPALGGLKIGDRVVAMENQLVSTGNGQETGLILTQEDGQRFIVKMEGGELVSDVAP